MPISRRSLVISACGAFGLIAAGGAWRVTRLPEAAVKPWALPAERHPDIRLEAFRHAILAPNPHNRQPWQIRLIGTSEALISCDLNRRLPATDPYDRQIVIGFGCFVELAVIAAAQHGFRVDVMPFPEGAPEMPQRLDQRPIVRLVFTEDKAIARDPLFEAIRARRSSKIPYALSRAVPEAAFSALAGASSGGIRAAHALSAQQVEALRSLIQKAWDVEYRTTHTWKETVDLLRVGSNEINENPDGVSLRGPFFEALSLLGGDQVRAQAADPNASASISTVKRYVEMFAATPALIWLASADNRRITHLASGRAYLRQNLIATAMGLSMQPVSQALQEYPEMAAFLVQAKVLCGLRPEENLQMLSRLGYGSPVAATPRWPLEAKIRT